MSKALWGLLQVFLICGLVFIVGCGSDNKTTSPVESRTYIHVPFPDGSYFARVRSISVTATGAGITTPITAKDTTIVGTTQTDLSIAIPAGADRIFDIIASDSLGQNLYRTQFNATVTSGGRTDLSAILMPIGYGTPTKVKVFKDHEPWGYASTDSVLRAAGFTLGAGSHQYQVLASALMGSVTLTPGTDLVIIEGQQDTLFYKNYMTARELFDNFVDQGGQLFFVAGTYNETEHGLSLIFPDSVLFDTTNSLNDYTAISDHPITVGQAETMTGADVTSLCYFTNLPQGTLVLNNNMYDNPVTVIYAYGKGNVILTGQALEFYRHWHNNYPTMGSILSKTIRFLLGLDPTPEPLPKTGNTRIKVSTISE
jgi:hypothetical protein